MFAGSRAAHTDERTLHNPIRKSKASPIRFSYFSATQRKTKTKTISHSTAKQKNNKNVNWNRSIRMKNTLFSVSHRRPMQNAAKNDTQSTPKHSLRFSGNIYWKLKLKMPLGKQHPSKQQAESWPGALTTLDDKSKFEQKKIENTLFSSFALNLLSCSVAS